MPRFLLKKIISAAVPAAVLFFYMMPLPALAGDLTIAVLVSRSSAPYQEALSGFRRYLDKQKVSLDYEVFFLEGKPEKAEDAIEKCRKMGADLLLTLGSFATQKVRDAGLETPLVAGMILKAENIKKQANVTGVTLELPLELQLKWLKRFLPECRTVGVLYNPEENGKRIEMAARVAAKMGLRLQAHEVQSPKDIPGALKNVARDADALLSIADKTVYTPQTAKRILLFSFRNRIPLVGLSGSWVKAGALYALDYDYSDLGEQCGELVLKVLKKGKADSFPPAPPRTVLYSVNAKTIRHMKLKIPDTLMNGAHHVF